MILISLVEKYKLAEYFKFKKYYQEEEEKLIEIKMKMLVPRSLNLGPSSGSNIVKGFMVFDYAFEGFIE